MKIALLGYGKMGKEIEKIALERGHEIVLRKTEENDFSGLENADVAIDFSIPTAAIENVSTCFNHNIPVISGTTGWLENYQDMVALCNEKNGAFLYGSNFSVGVNLFFELNTYLAKLMSKVKEYNVSMEEIHHTQKLDAPSGTAISLAEGIFKETNYNAWSLENPLENEIHIDAKRIADVPGTHSVFYKSAVDEIEIKHTAFNRQGFALGAVVAAEWILGKKGIFSMKDVLSLG
ncbi:4-hydroxy-tetrahydrodipicolinate reductase [Flavobacterium sp. xlx-214]|uniref:4-hydroxy-tetrahydrodipicolinate reductase n=1 Tax=unclassified Flavobacterium TaxID=196869 RepID=UPI0013D1C4EC|nr:MULTISPECIES: 4-hydroxy-tetrahydrodipicolinate reductase [unclassified Flavobacterium]MBA5791284.1 4-hydroxy-tetrahydrodipicolinate reductase [Flavobacterium sp. xlx-221]QMI83556.1 4-hydroxy-tetrahydrodipicolinate reductase [Flavobacterium sp. xlx-214]